MKNAEDHIFDDGEAGLQSVESSVLTNADQDQGQDLNLDELYSMLGESSASESDQSEVEVSMDSETTSAEAVNDESSVLDELEAMYSGLDSSNEESDSISIMDELEAMHGDSDASIIDEADSTSVSVMEELEAMYGSFSKSTDNDESSSINDHESAAESVSTLDELEALLGNSIEPANDTESSDTFLDSNYEHLFENRRSVLDELQNLLQSSIEELSDSADSHSMDVEYPSRNELKTLLEEKLSQLMMISNDSESVSFDEASSVLDELNALMKETGGDTSASNSYLSSSPSDDLSADKDDSMSDDIDEYISSITSTSEDSQGDDVASSVLDEFESLLSGTVETTGSEVAQEPEVGSVSAETDSTVDVLEQLEEMLAETVEPENDDISDEVKAVEDDFVIKPELTDLSGKDKEETSDEIKVAETFELNEKERAAAAHKNRLIQQSLREETYLSDETESTKSLPIWGILVIAVVVSVFVFWNLYGEGKDQVELASDIASPVSQPSLETITTADIPEKSDDITGVDNINDLLASIEASKGEQKPSYDYESDETPVQSYVDESLSTEESDSEVEMEVSPIEPSAEPMTPVTSEQVIEPVVIEPFVEDVKTKAGTIWSVHLMSYYNQAPPANELEFLNVAEIPYKVEKVIINGGDWYRVLVNKTSEYRIAKQYAELLKKRLGIKKIWISKSQNADD